MRRLLDSSGFWVAMLLALFCGLGLLVGAAWLAPLREGQAAVDAGRLEVALERFAAAEARFDGVPLSKQVLPTAYTSSQANQLWVLYQLGDHEALLEKASLSVARAPIHFWAGCALFVKATEEVEAEARIGWFSRASEEFRKALELEPDDWDIKYNYELTERLLAILRDKPEEPPSELLQLLRPEPKEGQRPVRRVG
jgi:tetratricopeptide (TPR) repeat protein